MSKTRSAVILAMIVLSMFITAMLTISYAHGETLTDYWIFNLEGCESLWNPHAINRHDTDGLASFGILQFHSETFRYFSKKYSIPGNVFIPEAEEAIVRRMLADPSVKIRNQFPGCIRKYGMPPVEIGS